MLSCLKQQIFARECFSSEVGSHLKQHSDHETIKLLINVSYLCEIGSKHYNNCFICVSSITWTASCHPFTRLSSHVT